MFQAVFSEIRFQKPVTATMAPYSFRCLKAKARRLLVVEDEDSLRESVSEYLNERGYIVLQGRRMANRRIGFVGPPYMGLFTCS